MKYKDIIYDIENILYKCSVPLIAMYKNGRVPQHIINGELVEISPSDVHEVMIPIITMADYNSKGFVVNMLQQDRVEVIYTTIHNYAVALNNNDVDTGDKILDTKQHENIIELMHDIFKHNEPLLRDAAKRGTPTVTVNQRVTIETTKRVISRDSHGGVVYANIR